jgi:hypothetical protein
MKFNSFKISFFVILISTFTGCRKDHFISEKQQILFQYDYYNSDLGIQHSGFLIDNKGNVLTYNNPENWNYPDKYHVLTENKVAENIQKCKLSGVKIPKEQLNRYTVLIRNIAASKVSARRNVTRDSGTIEYICFQYTERTGSYEGHLIKMEGNSTCENLNFFSKKIATWMRDISHTVNVR